MDAANIKASSTCETTSRVASSNTAQGSIQFVGSACTQTVYHLYTAWLMIDTNIKCIAIPMTTFGMLSACSGLFLTNDYNLQAVLLRAPISFLWLCLMLLHFGASNQVQAQAIEEDKVNKPWRPIPSGRITQRKMQYLFFALIPLEIIISTSLGTIFPCIAHMILTSLYDDLKLADTGYFMRNILIAIGYICYASGSTIIATGLDSNSDGMNSDFWLWMSIVAAQIFTTIQVQDLPDIEGDLVKGRRTMPIVLGDAITRWFIAVPIVFWSLFCPTYWNCGLISSVMVICSGSYVSARVLLYRSVEEDKITWRSWCVWATFLYCLPLAYSLSV